METMQLMTDQPPQLIARAPGIAEIRLSRPAKANRLDMADLAALARHLDQIERDPDARVLVLSGEGRVFCAGFDLDALEDENPETHYGGPAEEGAFERFANRLAETQLMTIAAIDGAVAGGATDLVLACDFRIGSDAASFMMPAARYGIPLYASALDRFVTRLGIDQAKRLVFLGETIDAVEMQRVGVLAELVTRGEIEARVTEIAAYLAGLPSRPLATMKATLAAAARGSPITAETRARLAATFDMTLIRARVDAARAERKRR
jgi:enoyl-CoA hydratase